MFKAGDIVTDLHAAIARYGRPERLLTDHGALFTGAYRGHGWVALEREAVALGIALRHCRPYHPQTCGKVQRFHQTLKNWLARQPRPRTLADLQTPLDTFAEYYNHHRPHRGVGRRTPASAWTARPALSRPGKASRSANTSASAPTASTATANSRHNSRLHHIGIGRRHAGTRVLMLVHERDIRVVAEDTGELLRAFTLDPTRDYQPQTHPTT